MGAACLVHTVCAIGRPCSLSTPSPASRPAPRPASYALISARQGAPEFNQPLTLDTSRVTDMSFMFSGARGFNQPLSFDTSSVTTMESMFSWTASMSDTNRLLIRCAWAGNNAFEIAYGSNWVIYPDGSLPDLNWVSGPCA